LRAALFCFALALPAQPLSGFDAADEMDDLVLKRTVYGALSIQDLTPELITQMLAAAERRLERRQQQQQKQEQLVKEGVVARRRLEESQQALQFAQQDLDLARQRARTFEELRAFAEAERDAEMAPEAARPLMQKGWLTSPWREERIAIIEGAWLKQFGRPMPVSARGSTEFHRQLGLDHTGRVDVAVTPDSAEGQWLLQLLNSLRLPHIAFRAAISGKSTAPHIHIGPPSARLRLSTVPVRSTVRTGL
jgi:hypothetical protein